MTARAPGSGRLVVLLAAAMFDGVGSALVAGPLVVIAGSALPFMARPGLSRLAPASSTLAG